MKFTAPLALLTLLFYVCGTAQQNPVQCTSTYARSEVRNLSSDQWNIFKDVITSMKNDGVLAQFAQIHNDNFGTIHGNSMFFPFHRLFIWTFENIARTRYNSGFILPFWDSALDYQAPQDSPVLSSSYIGGNGVSSNHCVSDGMESGWIMTYPDSHCLQREYDGPNGTIDTWYSPEFILSLMNRDSNMTTFRPDIEFSIHGAVHVGLGGDMGQGFSPNDIAFMLHHANIDRIWWRWPDTGNKIWTMDGPGPNGIQNLGLDDQIIYYNQPISSVMELGCNQIMCYSYSGGSSSNPTGSLPSRASRLTQTPKNAATVPPPTTTGNSEDKALSNILLFNNPKLLEATGLSNPNGTQRDHLLFVVAKRSNCPSCKARKGLLPPTTTLPRSHTLPLCQNIGLICIISARLRSMNSITRLSNSSIYLLALIIAHHITKLYCSNLYCLFIVCNLSRNSTLLRLT